MAIKSEVGWTRKNEDGTKLEISARRFGREWLFFHQLKRAEEVSLQQAPGPRGRLPRSAGHASLSSYKVLRKAL